MCVLFAILHLLSIFLFKLNNQHNQLLGIFHEQKQCSLETKIDDETFYALDMHPTTLSIESNAKRPIHWTQHSFDVGNKANFWTDHSLPTNNQFFFCLFWFIPRTRFSTIQYQLTYTFLVITSTQTQKKCHTFNGVSMRRRSNCGRAAWWSQNFSKIGLVSWLVDICTMLDCVASEANPMNSPATSISQSIFSRKFSFEYSKFVPKDESSKAITYENNFSNLAFIDESTFVTFASMSNTNLMIFLCIFPIQVQKKINSHSNWRTREVDRIRIFRVSWQRCMKDYRNITRCGNIIFSLSRKFIDGKLCSIKFQLWNENLSIEIRSTKRIWIGTLLQNRNSFWCKNKFELRFSN